MQPIQMVDLKGQYSKIKGKVDLAIHEVLDSTAFINGKPVTEFAQNLSSYRH
jgi:dTDP-4-amino-4,6-dideoxygalactose transaminase